MTRGSEPSREPNKELHVQKDGQSERKPGSYALIDKIRGLYRSGDFKGTMDEIKHYLQTFAFHVKSPLIIQLMDLFKLVIVKDIERLDEHLDTLDLLFNRNMAVDIRSELLDIFAKLSSVDTIKGKLFSRYFPVVKTRVHEMDVETKSSIIDLLVFVSNGTKAMQEAITRYFMERMLLAGNDEAVEILAGWKKMLRYEPALDLLFDDKLAMLLDMYSSLDGEDVDSAFYELVPHLQRYHVRIIETCQKWLGSGYLKLNYKAARLIPHLHPTAGEKECLDDLMCQLDTEDLEYQSNVVEAVVELAAKNFPYYLSRIVNRFASGQVSKNERMGVIELFTVLASKDFNAIFDIVFDAWHGGEAASDNLFLSVLKNLAYEYPVRFETALMQVATRFQQYHTGKKHVMLDKFATISREFKVETVLTWLARFLKEITFQSHIYDEDIAARAMSIYNYIGKEKIPGLETELMHIQSEIDKIEREIEIIKDHPRRLREQVDAFITSGDVRQGTKYLDNEYSQILQNIFQFDAFIDNLNFKHLIVDIIDEWYQAKEYIIEDLNLVKDYHVKSIKKHLRVEESNTLHDVKNLESRACILDATISDIAAEIDRLDGVNDHERLEMLGRVQDFETSILALDNEFYKFFFLKCDDKARPRKILDGWEENKKRMQATLHDIETKLHAGTGTPSNGVQSNSIEMYEQQVKQTIVEYKGLLQKIDGENKAFDNDTLLQDIQGAEKTLTYIQNQYMDYITQRASAVVKYWNRLNENNIEIAQLVALRKLHDDMEGTRANLVEKIQEVFKNKLEIIDVARIKQMLNVLSPIPVDILKQRLKSISTDDNTCFTDELLTLISKYNINTKVMENNIYNNEARFQRRQNADFIKIKASLVDKDNSILLKGIVENNSIQDIYDVSINMMLPSGFREKDAGGKLRTRYQSVLESNKTLNLAWELEKPTRDHATRKEEGQASPRIVILVNGKTSNRETVTKSEELYLLY